MVICSWLALDKSMQAGRGNDKSELTGYSYLICYVDLHCDAVICVSREELGAIFNLLLTMID